MNQKMIAIATVVVIVIAGGASAFVLMSPNSDNDDTLKMTHRLMVMGNVCSDDTLDSNDIDVLNAVVNGDKEIVLKGETIDLTDEALLRYSDVNQDGVIDQKDVNSLRDIIDGKVTKLYYENAKGEITSVNVPINNLVVMFRRVATTVVMIGASDMVCGYISDLSSTGNYGFLNLPGESVGVASSPDYEMIRQMDADKAGTGGVTLIADATGSATDLETKVGSGIDVVRMPVTEMGKSENGVVTLAYLLAYNNSHKSTIEEKLGEWISWNDAAKERIEAAVADLDESDKMKGIIGMWNASAGASTVNVRGPGVSEYEYTKMCGCNNIGVNTSYSITELNEYLLAEKPEVLLVMQQEVFLLRDHVSVETTYQQLMDQLTDNYNGKVGMFSQFFGTGPAYILSLMYYANLFVPELEGAFDLEDEYRYFMETFLGNTELADIPAFVMAS